MTHRMIQTAVIALLAGAVSASSNLHVAGNSTEYDFIVVGGGTAGLTVATRLAQHSFEVAVVEAGSRYEDNSFAAFPAAVVLPSGSDPTTDSPIDWGFVTEEFPGANHRRIHFPRGKCLGGSSALNWMIYQRPSKNAMQLWAQVVNDSSYQFEHALPYFQQSVNFTAPNAAVRLANATADYDAAAFDLRNGGPVQVSYPNYAMPFSTWMKLGVNAMGIEETKDFNSGTLMGSQYCSSTIQPLNQTRSSSDAFLSIDPLPLTVYDNTVAQKVVLDANKRATGVEISGNITLRARREVILSAGAIQSPQLLMLSGIGPEETLRSHAIYVLVDLPGNLREPNGPLGSPIADFLAWEKIPATHRKSFDKEIEDDLSRFPSDWPEAEASSSLNQNLAEQTLTYLMVKNQPRDGYQYASILGTLVAPTSRGSVTIASGNISEPPLINPNWLATETDQRMAVAIFKRVREAFQSRAMAPVVIGEEYFPGPGVQTDEEILEFIRDNVMTIFHPACTCKMGVNTDPMAVVDSQGRVFGTHGLRVIDASAFPILPPGHPQATFYMLAEKLAHQIVQDYDRARDRG
ncbi:GMC family oxidoreductase [Aspergillus thermomutatus]|uniref:Glucose-methanol-choline oxidoreductase N-terminal domain-containing protein n=1 Tax=Aspergillus thermomutatus TaxID=41047 RepID=A0A397GBC8_ASPTH|nr:uncharacterized protein CDV56_102976 [Aspergillus thermomutatus]RHZ46918.1 hypothetical protein CDV56_102976 [Aspergillus thermomutatus]